MPKGKRLRFHCFRKRFLSECANLKIDINTAKILVGKSVSKDMLTYLSEVEHKKAFEEVHNKLRLTEVKAVINAKDTEIEELKRQLRDKDIMIQGLIEALKNPQKRAELEQLTTIKASTSYVRELGEEAERKQAEEYKKLIEENNNNNH